MKDRRPLNKFLLIVTALVGYAAELCAAGTATEDSSNLFVWIFLGFFALIVIAQFVPAVMMMLGFVKGAKKSQAPPASESINHLTPSDV